MIKTWTRDDLPVLGAAGVSESISICLPARNEEKTVGQIVESLSTFAKGFSSCEVVVIDDRSSDNTAAVAECAGAKVYSSTELMPEFGEVLGKGDVMWRALSVITGELVCFLDADVENFDTYFVSGLIGPLLTDPQIQLVKANYSRPLVRASTTFDNEGGRVNALMARPLLKRFFPELSAIEQPLAGEVALRTEHANRLSFQAGYGIEIGMLIDTFLQHGAAAIGQSDLGLRVHRNRPLLELERISEQVLAAVLQRAGVSEPALDRSASMPLRSARVELVAS